MIKRSTVIKRMIKDGWKPVAGIVSMIVAVMLFSIGMSHVFGLDADVVYYFTLAVLGLVFGVKWIYEMKKADIEFEQKQMLRDLEKKHL